MLHVKSVPVSLLLFILAEFVHSEELLQCNVAEGWFSLKGDKCYKLFYENDERTWRRADEICKRYGSHLVNIGDQFENNELGERVDQVAGSRTSYWIGMAKMTPDDCSFCTEKKWSNGKLVTDNEGYWKDGQPDDAIGDCVFAQYNKESYLYDRPYAWSYDNCNRKRAFVCEKKAAPTGSIDCFYGGFTQVLNKCNGKCDCGDCSDEMDCTFSGMCKYYHKGNSGSLTSVRYRDSQTCTWAIQTPLGTNVRVELKNIDTELGSDFITVYYGSIIDNAATSSESVSGSLGTREFQSANNMILLKFTSDSTVTTSGNIFEGRFWSVETGASSSEVKLTARDATQHYTIGSNLQFNSQRYIGSSDYVIIIETEKPFGPEIITVEVTSLNLQDSDKVMFYDGDAPDSLQLAEMCNKDCDNQRFVFSTGRTLSIYIRTDTYSPSKSFTFRYTQGCVVDTSDKWGSLSTPGYRKVPYPNSLECVFRITPSEPILLYFDDDLQFSDEDYGRPNNRDYLQIYENGARLSDHGFNTTELKGEAFRIPSGNTTLVFKTSPIRASIGFMVTWSIDCPDPKYDEFTILNPLQTEFYYTAKMTLSCALGYAFQQEQIAENKLTVEVECGFMGKWKTYRQIPRCTPVYCGKEPELNNGFVAASEGYTYQKTITYECNAGSTLQPPSKQNISCLSNGNWESPPTCITASCDFTEILMNIRDGKGELVLMNGNEIGSIVKFTCDPGFEFVGEPIVHCEADGQWSQLSPSCKKLTCMLPTVEHGDVGDVLGTGFIDFDEFALVSCSPGYTLQNVSIDRVTCLANRSFSELPVCINEDECNPINPCLNGGTCVDTEGSFKCECPIGYYLDAVTCKDIDECSIDNGNCDQRCENSIGSYKCYCTKPTVLYEYDGKSGYSVPDTETGLNPNDTYHIGHSCVLLECNLTSEMMNFANGKMLTQREHHHFGDVVEFICNIGYQDNTNPSPFKCESTGNWAGRLPDCEQSAAVCETENPFNLQNVAVFKNGPYNYLEKVYLNCSRDDGDFSWFRHCTYNRAIDKYELQGSPYECGRVSCGQPKKYSGTSDYTRLPSEVFVGDSFRFSCLSAYIKSGNSQAGDDIVRCQSNGDWDFGDLQCFGQACADPGILLGGSVTATNFLDKSELTFACLKEGYGLSNNNTYYCDGTQWLGTFPSCIDITKPVFQDCPTETVKLEQYERLGPKLYIPVVTDNTGIRSLTVEPENAATTYYMLTSDSPLTVTFTATDFAGNQANCIITVVLIDEIPPSLTCPPLLEIELTDADSSVTQEVNKNLFIFSDNNFLSQTEAEINDAVKDTFTRTDLYNTYTYQGVLADDNNNLATCKSQVFVKAATCSELSFTTPLNAGKICINTVCTIKCYDEFTFNSAPKERQFSCNAGVWTPEWIPACIPDIIPPEVTCPPEGTIYIAESAEVTEVDFSDVPGVQITDLNEYSAAVFDPPSANFSVGMLYKPVEVRVSVTDKAGNTGSCRFQYILLPEPCSPLSLPITENAIPNECSRRNGFFDKGYDCNITCKDGFVLGGNEGLKKSISCTDGNMWAEEDIYPTCVTDTVPPNLVCPTSANIYIEKDEVKNVIFSDANYPFEATDAGGLSDRFLFSPAQQNFEANMINQTPLQVSLTIQDLANNVASCSFWLTVKAYSCSPLSISAPPNGEKTCSDIGTGWSCEASCNPGYKFHDRLQNTVVSSCTNGGDFNIPVFPACTNTNSAIPKLFTGQMQYFYRRNDISTANIPSDCATYYRNRQMNTKVVNMAASLESYCNFTFVQSNTIPDVEFVDAVASITANNEVQIIYTYKMTFVNSEIISKCGNSFATQIAQQDNLYPLSLNIAGNGSVCPNLEWTNLANQLSTDKSCSKPYFSSLVNSDECLMCPAGTQSDADAEKCDICSKGSYRVDFSVGACVSCGSGATTKSAGSTSQSQCISQCLFGTVSEDGYKPCYPCAKGTYAVNATTCLPCETGSTTFSTGSQRAEDCQPVTTTTVCSIGTQLNPVTNKCDLCPEGSFRDLNSQVCQSCFPPSLKGTYMKGAISASSCIDLCHSGMYSSNGKAPCKECPRGTYWFNNTYCSPCSSDQTTIGTGSTSSSSCVAESSVRARCPKGTFRDENVCTKCPIGFYSAQEESSMCFPCGSSKSTFVEGANAFSMCYDKCERGFYSLSGLSPCVPCGKGKYWVNASFCENCPNGGDTATSAAASISECNDVCPIGTFSYDGYQHKGFCRQCPENHYQDQTQSETCIRCNTFSGYTSGGRKTAASDCQDAQADLCSNCVNGATCTIKDNTFYCECPTGYTGRTCSEQVDHCQSGPCYHNGVCTNTETEPLCDCGDDPFVTGTFCETLLPRCNVSTCDNGGQCQDLFGNYKCHCVNGFGGDRCIDLTLICPGECDTDGTRECKDVSNNNNIRKKCVCNDGYEGEHCENIIDLCASSPCINEGVCSYELNKFTCTCKEGYRGEYCEIRTDRCQNKNCANGYCIDDQYVDEPRCICEPGYSYGKYEQYELLMSSGYTELPTNEFTATVGECRENCSSQPNCVEFIYNPVSSNCYMSFTEQTVVPKTGFYIYKKKVLNVEDDFWTDTYSVNKPSNSNSNKDEEKRDELNSQYGLNICGGTTPLDARCCPVGQTCNELFDLPSGYLCNTDGLKCFKTSCDDYSVQFKCAAHRVFQDNICTYKQDYCLSAPCENGGNCVTEFGTFRCICPAGWGGKSCQINLDECSSSPCKGGGTCVDLLNDYRCECPEGLEGKNCQQPVNYCVVNTVQCINGNCKNLPTDFICDCYDGYEGRFCETETFNCKSKPCLHNSQCISSINDYECKCEPGWTGKNCDILVTSCDNSQTGGKCNPSSCYEIFNDYYCKCSANTQGKNCEDAQDRCLTSNCCLNGQCRIDNDDVVCDCPMNYTGEGCHILVDHCGKTNYCQNGGTCINNEYGYSCECVTGYEGDNCQMETNECLTTVCSGGGVCLDDIGIAHCRCQFNNKTGKDCLKDIDTNYDLCFDHPLGLGYAWIPYYIAVNNTEFLSMSMWVRYIEKDATGIYATVFTRDSMSNFAKFMEFTETGLKIYVPYQGQNHFTLEYDRDAKVNNGNWNLVIVNFNLMTGDSALFLNTIRHDTIQADSIKMLNADLKTWVYLGCEFDKNNERCTGQNSFHGCLSQVNWYKQEVPYGTAMNQVYTNAQLTFGGQLLAWKNYHSQSGVNRHIPSEAGSVSCDTQGRNPPCRFYQVSSLLRVSRCPDDIVVLSDRIISIPWDEPLFDNLGLGTVSIPTHLPGSTFTWGKNNILYIAQDEYNNKAYCSFNIYVQASFCEKPEDPIQGIQDVTDDDPEGRRGIQISCLTPQQYTIDRKHPDIFTCDATGTWNLFKYHQKFRYPSCGRISNEPRVRVEIRLVYIIDTEAYGPAITNLQARLKETWLLLKSFYTNRFCIPDDCSGIKSEITAGANTPSNRKKRQANIGKMLALVTIPSADPKTILDNEEITMQQFLMYFGLGADVFNINTSVSGGDIEKDLFYVKVTQICPEGEVLKDNKCVICGPGNYFRYITVDNEQVAICDDCPLGQFKDSFNYVNCTSCGEDFTTEMTGSYDVAACKTKCPVGEMFDNTIERCMKCPIGFYQDEVGQFYCKGCDAGYTTEFEGTNSSFLCSETCDSGKQLAGTGNCVKCPVGQYRDATLTRTCEQCPGGNITISEGATSALLCTVVACNPGSKRNEVTEICELCEVGTYQDEKWQTSCKSCGDAARYITDNKGSIKQEDCKYYCPSGFEVESEGNCKICEVGYYKNNDEDIHSMCKKCDGNLRTATKGSTNKLNCTIYKCPVGYKPTSDNSQCEKCPLGTFQDVPFSTECKSCESGESTRYTASNSSTDCETYCASGLEKKGDACEPCPKGTYKDNTDGYFSVCTLCESLYTTANEGSISAGNCSIRTCPAGTKRTEDDLSCDPCPIGTYQPKEYQTVCLNCSVMTSTKQVNSTNINQCEVYCASGLEMTENGCQPCQLGYYKNNLDENGVFQMCQLCPEDYITSDVGSVSVGSCTIANCSAGYKRENNVCIPCPIKTYQPDKWQSECITCGLDKTTEFNASTSLSNCILECPPGKEDINGACQLCGRGFYKVEYKAAACTACDTGTTTRQLGSTSKVSCDIPACLPGSYLNDDGAIPVCSLCPYDQFQAQLWQYQCESCPSDEVTLQMGSDHKDKCVANCTSGSAYMESINSCETCEIGYYRNQFIRSQTTCQLCDIDYITNNPGAKDKSECDIANCTTPGYYRNIATNTCQKCPLGQYNNIKWRSACTPCPSGESTLETGSTSKAACRPTCNLGQYVNPNNECQQCPKGTYRSDSSQVGCQNCTSGLTTPGFGSNSPDDCSLTPCVAGEFYILSDERCEKCFIGHYQPLSGQYQCKECPFTIQYTPRRGAVSIDECKSPCNIGEQFNNNTRQCETCLEGYYQPAAQQYECIACPAGRKYTGGRGSSSINSCLSFCNNLAVNRCSPNATCQEADGTPNGYTCSCFRNFDDIGSFPGQGCVHKCDRNLCKNSATCYKDPLRCECSEYYTGLFCETSINKEELSSDTLKIIIPVGIGAGGLILFLVILAVCCLCWMNRRKKPAHTTQYSEFQGDRIDKTSLRSFEYGQVPYGVPHQRLMLPNSSEVVYDNMAFKQDPAVYTA